MADPDGGQPGVETEGQLAPFEHPFDGGDRHVGFVNRARASVRAGDQAREEPHRVIVSALLGRGDEGGQLGGVTVEAGDRRGNCRR